MANWCDTEYAFEGSKKDTEELAKVMKGLLAKKRRGGKDSWKAKPEWLGYVAKDLLGEKSLDEEDCRGSFYISKEEEPKKNGKAWVVRLSASTAWRNQNWLFKELADKFNLKLYWQSSEFNEDYWETNDTDGKYFSDRYYLETCEDGCYYATEKEVKKSIAIECGIKAKKNEDLKTYIDRVNAEEEVVLNIQTCEVVDDDSDDEDEGVEEFFKD